MLPPDRQVVVAQLLPLPLPVFFLRQIVRHAEVRAIARRSRNAIHHLGAVATSPCPEVFDRRCFRQGEVPCQIVGRFRLLNLSTIISGTQISRHRNLAPRSKLRRGGNLPYALSLYHTPSIAPFSRLLCRAQEAEPTLSLLRHRRGSAEGPKRPPTQNGIRRK